MSNKFNRASAGIPDDVATAIVVTLKPYIQITPRKIQEVLAQVARPTVQLNLVRPLTRQQAADAIQCSLQAVNRYLNAGVLKRIHIGKRAVRVDAASVQALLNGGLNAAETSEN